MFVAKLGFSDVSPGLLLWFIVTNPACHIKVDLDNDYLSSQSDVSDASNATNHGPHKPATSLQGHIKIDLAGSLQRPCLVTWDERLKKAGNLWDWPNIAGFLWRCRSDTLFWQSQDCHLIFRTTFVLSDTVFTRLPSEIFWLYYSRIPAARVFVLPLSDWPVLQLFANQCVILVNIARYL